MRRPHARRRAPPPRLPDQIDPTDPTPAQITAWAAYQATLHRDQRHRADDPDADRGLAPTTIRARLTVLAAYLDHTHQHQADNDDDGSGRTGTRRRRASGAVVRPALQQLEHDRPPDPPLAYLSAAQEAQAQAAAHRAGPLPHAIFALITLYGQPVSHLPRMTVADVDLTTDPPLLHTRPATAGTRRTVPLVGSALTALTDWIAVHPDPRPDAPLLATRHGHRPDQPARPLTRQAISKQLHSALADLQVPTDTPGQTRRPTLTDLRHTFAARCIAHGVTPEELKDYTGITWSGHQRGLRTPLTPPERRAAATGTTHPAAPPQLAEHPLTDHLTPTPRPRRIATRHYELLAGEDRARTALLHTAIQQIPDLLARALALPPRPPPPAPHPTPARRPQPPRRPRPPHGRPRRPAPHRPPRRPANPTAHPAHRRAHPTRPRPHPAAHRRLLAHRPHPPHPRPAPQHRPHRPRRAPTPRTRALPQPRHPRPRPRPRHPRPHRRPRPHRPRPPHPARPPTNSPTCSRRPSPAPTAPTAPPSPASAPCSCTSTLSPANCSTTPSPTPSPTTAPPTPPPGAASWPGSPPATSPPPPTPHADHLLHHALLLTHHAATDPEADLEADGDDGAATGPSPAA
ncbi:tyrosine-type recombinase/integrase [Conexibacter sp. W3-3-2]|nr:tyrosine-type recombinase/integrase [Conexibacter sp. W3-3-2]